jgi:catechol 2,3-dioxygenase-like lactoylglutathione lyase family enzyme
MSAFGLAPMYGRTDTGGLLSALPAMAFAATAQPVRARAFYGYVLGLGLIEDLPTAFVFDAGGSMLRVLKVRAVRPAPYAVLGWQVRDIVGVMRTLTARGVASAPLPDVAQDPDGIWIDASGTKFAWFADPDGNLLSLIEPRS